MRGQVTRHLAGSPPPGSLQQYDFATSCRNNTYAKKKTALQRTLDMLWIIHNFIRPHFTTRRVPAVASGIVEKGLSWGEVLMIQKTA